MRVKGQSIILDELDWKILHLLEENSRQTYTEIGQKLNVAHSTVYERIKKMEKYGLIKKYTTAINFKKLGLNYVTSIMTIFTDPKESENIAKELSKFKNVLEVYTSISEELLVVAKVVTKDQEELHSLIAHKIAPLSGVLRIRTLIITKKHKEEPLLSSLIRRC